MTMNNNIDYGRLYITPDLTQKPWVCPVCGAGVAPHATVCPCVPLVPRYTNAGNPYDPGATYGVAKDPELGTEYFVPSWVYAA